MFSTADRFEFIPAQNQFWVKHPEPTKKRVITMRTNTTAVAMTPANQLLPFSPVATSPTVIGNPKTFVMFAKGTL